MELPDNLKSYFRPVAMMVPDTNMITEVLLFTNTFTTASSLALKLTKFYEVIKSQISHQVYIVHRLSSLKSSAFVKKYTAQAFVHGASIV